MVALAYSEVVVNVLLEVLFLFSAATRQMKQGEFSEHTYIKTSSFLILYGEI